MKLFFWQMVENGNEGIVVKRLDSEWIPDNRDGRWSKVKPDYVFVGNDLDLLIIGGYYGSGSRGGKIASFLLALVDANGDGARFISICRCGQGLSEEEFNILESKLSPYIIPNLKGGRPPATCGYLVTNSRYECPDVWVSRPDMSVVLQVSSEKRIYPTQTFKAGWTFRFPRIVKVRYDKCWKEALGVEEFNEIVRSAKEHGNSMLHGSQFYNQLCQSGSLRKRIHTVKSQTVLSCFQELDMSHVKKIHNFFEDFIFYICSNEPDAQREALRLQIKQCGGRIVPNFVNCVTHIVASEAKGFLFNIAVQNDKDIICTDWIWECLNAKAVLPLAPRHFLFQSSRTKTNELTRIDMYGDPWFEDIDVEDLQKIVAGISAKDWPVMEQTYGIKLRKELSKERCWNLFEGCHFYFHEPLHSGNLDSRILANITLSRLRLDAEMLGASSSCDITCKITHVIVYVPLESKIPTRRAKQLQRILSKSPHINVVSHLWVERCLKEKKLLSIQSYVLGIQTEGTENSEPGDQQLTSKIRPGRFASSSLKHQKSIKKPDSSVIDLESIICVERSQLKNASCAYQPISEEVASKVQQDPEKINKRIRPCRGTLISPKNAERNVPTMKKVNARVSVPELMVCSVHGHVKCTV
ncbi:hypothetical protein KP509_17G068500 [Ceratopteris richardii]|uniref:DNA ligase 4 n=1 Tax=Ceratopteris richardii TaxID=49495 RepID=A0A8T2SXW4_CERRI|nr:hypothetical protein KP509_17G068500 [Ceratopteris richardii]